MIELKITLGNTFIERYYMPYNIEFGQIQPKISQHTIVLSQKIIDYYEECAKSKGQLAICQTYLQNVLIHQSRCMYIKDFGNDSIEKELIETAASQPMKILLAEKSEIPKATTGINLLTSKDIKDNDTCILNLYSLPVPCRYVKNNENAEKYSKWLGNWLKGERNIKIRDKYLLSERGIASFKKFYLPLFEKGANISIFTDEDISEEYIYEFDKSEYSDYLINIYKCSHMHERVIILDNFQIVIGKGLDFLRAKFENTTESFISITKVTIDTNYDVIEQLR